MSDNENSAYEKLTPARKALVDAVMKNLENGVGLWEQGWAGGGAPVSAISGKQYNGVNRMFLMAATAERGYSDNRWVTFKQMEDKGWSFKRDEEGRSRGKNAGVSIEYFELRDKETKQPFDRHTLDGMTADERNEYMDENVYPIRKYYRVFNGDVIEGIPERERVEHDPMGRNDRAEALIDHWSETQSPIKYGGSMAYYSLTKDEIHLPEKKDFVDMPEFYSTALHEIGHSTGHEKRLNRNLSGAFGSAEYAEEELRAEIASMFLEQDLGVAASDKHIENNSAYIGAWKSKIKEDPNVLFKAIADAERMTKFVMSKEKEIKRETEPFAVVEETDEYGETVYKVKMCAEYGQTQSALSGYPFRSRDALMAEFGKMQELSFWKGKTFEEVSLEELQARSIKRAEEQEQKEERLTKIEEEKSEVFLPPSAVAAASETESASAARTVDMTGKGIESLTRMEDRDLVERASKTKQGAKFSALFNGVDVLGSEEKNERSLMARLAVHTLDKDKLMRVFKASGQYRDDKPNAYYEKMATERKNGNGRNAVRIRLARKACGTCCVCIGKSGEIRKRKKLTVSKTQFKEETVGRQFTQNQRNRRRDFHAA